ncbi:MAB_1171c family putative transporter [Streptomyces antimycoticus]
MFHLFSYTIGAAMTTLAIWRLSAIAPGDTHRRALWACYAGCALALWLRSPAIRDWLNRSSITDLSVLLMHYAATASILAILTYVTSVEGPGASAAAAEPWPVTFALWLQRAANRVLLVQIVLMTVLFLTVVDRSAPSHAFVPDHAGQWGAALYMTVFHICLGVTSALCGYLWASALRRADTPLLRAGLILMCTSMCLSVVYVLIQLGFVWLAVAEPVNPQFALQLDTYVEGLHDGIFGLFAAGVCLPATSGAATRLATWRTLWRLHPLWRDLTTAIPDVAWHAPGPRLHEVTRLSMPLDVQLDRWTQEIADAVDQLRHHAPPMLLTVAEDTVADHDDAQPAAEALWIKAALCAMADGVRNDIASTALPTKPIANSYAEACWLVRVQTVYATITPSQAREVFRAAVMAHEPTG